MQSSHVYYAATVNEVLQKRCLLGRFCRLAYLLSITLQAVTPSTLLFEST